MEQNNNSLIDMWTIQHFLAGFVIGSAFPKRKIGYTLIIGWEIIENILMRSEFGHFFREIEGPINAISDTLVGLISYELGKKYGKRKIGN